MSNNITLKKSSVADKVPLSADLQFGELALNYADGNLFYKNSSNAITTLASNKFASVTGNVTGGNINTGGIVSATGDVFGKELWSTQSSGDEGGQLNLGIPATNTTLTGQVTIDVYQNKLRFFQGNSARGAYIDLAAAATSVGTNLLAGGGGTPGGSNTYVQFNDGGAFGGNAQFTYDKVTNTVTAGTFAGTLNGTGQTFKVGDDAWIGDINAEDTIGIKGQQNAANAYIVFGNSDSTGKLGRAGTGPLTYAGAFSATGNITGSYVAGNGSLLSAITGANVTGTVANATYAVSAGSATTAGTVTTNAQPNITSVGTLTGLTISGGLAVSGTISGNISGRAAVANALGVGIFTYSGNTAAATSTVALRDEFGDIYATTFRGSGAGLTSIPGANVTGAVPSATTAGTVTTNAQPNITSVGTLSSVSVTGNITGGNLLISGAIVDSAQLDIQTSAGNANIVLTPNGTGNVNIGRMSASGNITASYFIGNGSQLTGLPASGLTWTTVANTAPAGAKPGDFWYNSFSGIKYQYINDGTSNVWVDQSYPTTFSSLAVAGNGTIGGTLAVTGNVSAPLFVGTATQARYADLAENYSADAEYAPGTVLVFGGTHEVTVSAVSHDTRVAGVVSTAPAYLMNSAQLGAAVALTGKVPCQVQGPVGKGDLLVNISAGTAGRLDPAQYRPGCVVGKSLESIPDKITRTIEIAVGRF